MLPVWLLVRKSLFENGSVLEGTILLIHFLNGDKTICQSYLPISVSIPLIKTADINDSLVNNC